LIRTNNFKEGSKYNFYKAMGSSENKNRRVLSYRFNFALTPGLIDLLLALPTTFRGTPMIEIGSNIGNSTEIFSLLFEPVYSIEPFFDNI